MTMDMIPTMEMRMKWINRKQLLAASLLVALNLSLTGCVKPGPSVDENLAEQIALDAAGLKDSEVDNLEISSSGSGFSVQFSEGSGQYQIGIDSDGKVVSYEFSKEEPGSDSIENEEDHSVEDKSESEEPKEQPRLPEGSLPKSELISRMAVFLGIPQYDESDFTIESASPERVVMTVKFSDGRILFAELNPYTGQVVASGSR